MSSFGEALTMSNVLVTLLLLTAVPTVEHANWVQYLKTNRYQCPGPFDTLKKPRTMTLGGKTYVHSGYRLEVQNADADDTIKLGLLGSVKDASAPTKANLLASLAWFKQAGVEWIIANGDLGIEETDLEEVLRALAASDLPVLVLPGNSESRSMFARVYGRVNAANLVDGVFVRQIVADDIELWVLPGYYDEAFERQGAGCLYKSADIDAMLTNLKPAGKGPIALVSHGPPRGGGPLAPDFITDKRNVGDLELVRLIHASAIPFGFFGHIIEAGGSAVGADFATAVPPSTLAPALYVNTGSVSAEPWTMNDGSNCTGMAMIVTIRANQALYEIKRFPPAAP